MFPRMLCYVMLCYPPPPPSLPLPHPLLEQTTYTNLNNVESWDWIVTVPAVKHGHSAICGLPFFFGIIS